MRPNPDFDNRTNETGRWMPPKKRGSNVQYTLPGQQVPVSMMFYHDAHGNTGPVTQTDFRALHPQPVHHQTYSMYHARGMIWTVNYDATQMAVGDGQHGNEVDEEPGNEGDDDEESSSSSESRSAVNYDNWTELTFGRAAVDGYPSLSHAGFHCQETTLLAQHRGQDWVQHLIPRRYHSENTSTDHRAGGLVGDLPLLIGLVAMSLPTTAWPDVIPLTITTSPHNSRSWRISPWQVQNIAQGSECELPRI